MQVPITASPITSHFGMPADFLRFARRCLLFGMPILLFNALPMLILLGSGECFFHVDRVLQVSTTQPTLVGFAYNEQNYPHWKYQSLMQRPRQSVVALGSSRVLTIREQSFQQPFFNAGYTIQSAADFQTFLQLIPKAKLPEVLLIGLDQWMFNSEWQTQIVPAAPLHWTQPPADGVRAALKLTPKIYTDLFRGRISLAPLFGGSAGQDSAGTNSGSGSDQILRVGLNGVMNQKGFRNDGSFSYGRQVDQLLAGDPAVRDHQFGDTLSRVSSGGNRFNYGASVDSTAVAQIKELLKYCESHGVHVIAVIPPFADCVLAAMQKSERHQYLDRIGEELRPLFSEFGFELFEFPSMSACGSSDAEAIDGFHGGEVASLRMLLRMIKQGSTLNDYTDLQQLQDDLAAVVNRYVVY